MESYTSTLGILTHSSVLPLPPPLNTPQKFVPCSGLGFFGIKKVGSSNWPNFIFGKPSNKTGASEFFFIIIIRFFFASLQSFSVFFQLLHYIHKS